MAQQEMEIHAVALLHQLFSSSNKFVVEDITARHLIDNPLDAPHVNVTLLLGGFLRVGQRIKTQDVESQTVGHNHVTHHDAALLLRIMLLIEGIVSTVVFV